MRPRKTYLVVFDLNGTLIDRIKPTDREAKAASRLLTYGPDLCVRKYKVYLRPKVSHLFQNLHESIAVATWTSAHSHTTLPIIDKIFAGQHRETCEFMWFREDCDNADNYGDKNECKDLEKIWAKFSDFSCKNTMLVDDSVYKARKQPLNHIHIPQFAIGNPEPHQDDNLVVLCEYLNQIATTQPADIQSFLKDNPPPFK